MQYNISIIVPHYKTEAYIHKCTESILTQTIKDFELILVDDGSPDKCGEICDEFARKDNRIKVIHKENGGYSSAINAGLDIAQGKFIGIVDGDDYIKNDMYETLLMLALKYDADVVECNAYVVRREGIKPICNYKDNLVGCNVDALEKLLKWGWNSVLWNKLYRRDIFSDLRLPFGKRYSDSFIIHKILLKINKYVYTGECKYFYVKRSDSVMSQGYSLKRLEGLECHEERFYYLKDRINNKKIIELTEFEYFLEIIQQYYLIIINKKFDPQRCYRNTIRKHLLSNYFGFKKNKLLKKYHIWMNLAKINPTLFENLFKFYMPLSRNLYYLKCKCIIFIKTCLNKK